ncbi:hypothetical protein [Agrobacterium tumefaciens]|uniref:hypothetical protein n=1 Tax=Agrobacterium tumefaciens TaxID=358 RepID=UPI002242F987|nr:hypothetical protein [Agrobacterium tumefaciens]MCW8060673.1 hypothetical protein [Agrobacterium tumefaciens]
MALSTSLIPQPCDLCDVVTEELIELTFTDPLDDLRLDVHAVLHQFLMVAGRQIAEGRETIFVKLAGLAAGEMVDFDIHGIEIGLASKGRRVDKARVHQADRWNIRDSFLDIPELDIVERRELQHVRGAKLID